MSKTIELCSRHIGAIGVLIRGEQRTVTFEAKQGVGVAMCDTDEVEKLMIIGGDKKDYWVPGRKASAVEDRTTTPGADASGSAAPDTNPEADAPPGEAPPNPGAEEPSAAAPGAPGTDTKVDTTTDEIPPPPSGDIPPSAGDPKPLTPELYEKLTSVKKLAPHLEVTTDQRVLMGVIAAEAERPETRNTWMKALNDRLDVLQKAAE